MNRKNEEYNSPELTEYGSIQGITAEVSDSGSLDNGFPEGTPDDELGFSPTE